MAQTSQRAASTWQGSRPCLPGDLGQVTLVRCWNANTLILKTVVSAVVRSYQLAARSDPNFHSWEEQRGLPRATPLWPGACKLGLEPRRATLGSVARLSSTFFSLEKLPFPKRKVKQREKGLIFLYFLIKCHLLSVKQLSVSCSAWGQINISVTWGLWRKAQWTCSCQQLLLPLLCLASRILCPPHSSLSPQRPHPNSSHRPGPALPARVGLVAVPWTA